MAEANSVSVARGTEFERADSCEVEGRTCGPGASADDGAVARLPKAMNSGSRLLLARGRYTDAEHTESLNMDATQGTSGHERQKTRRSWRSWVILASCLGWAAAFSGSVRAELQFDVFLGYDGSVREAAWFPVACEVYNDGPSFNAVFELTSGNIRTEQVRRVAIELPTNTRKRFVIPVFASGGRFYQWEARLLDAQGKLRAEKPGLQPRIIPWEGFLLGALPRTFAGVPVLPNPDPTRPDLKPEVARLQPEQFPDNPIALEGLSALYLNTEKALSLNVNQVAALIAWVFEGGRLVVCVDQLGDVNSTPWLQQLLPMEVTETTNVVVDGALLEWLRQEVERGESSAAATGPFRRPSGRLARQGTLPERPADTSESLPMDAGFLNAEAPAATGAMRDGNVVLAAEGTPLIVEANRGRGKITVLTFNPEREPFRSWKHRELFWAELLDVQPVPVEYNAYSGTSLDGVFGALIESRQVRKLPVKWLLLLLAVYLIIIGPFDQYWLKKINRPMLTWITFPTYVVLFSLLIYFIGYRLRAGDTEWNELQVVDVLPRGQRAALRGRTFASIYSSANAKYPLAFAPASTNAAEQSYASLRGELLDFSRAGREGSRADVEQRGNLFRAEIFVPVWTSLLYVNDWFQPGAMPLTATLTNRNSAVEIDVENLLDRSLTEARAVYKGQVFELGTLPAREMKSFALDPGAGVPLTQWVMQHGAEFQSAARSRHRALGDETQGRLENLPLTSMVASFSAEFPRPGNQRAFIAPPGLDLTALVERGDAVVMAWDANESYTEPVNRFKPPVLQRNSLLRLAAPALVEPNL